MDFRKLLDFPESSFPWLPYLWVPQGKTRFKPGPLRNCVRFSNRRKTKNKNCWKLFSSPCLWILNIYSFLSFLAIFTPGQYTEIVIWRHQLFLFPVILLPPPFALCCALNIGITWRRQKAASRIFFLFIFFLQYVYKFYLSGLFLNSLSPSPPRRLSFVAFFFSLNFSPLARVPWGMYI